MRKGVAVITPVVVVCARLAVVARARRRRSPWRPDLGHLFRQWCRHRRAVLLRHYAAPLRAACVACVERKSPEGGLRGVAVEQNSAATQGVSSRPVRTSLPFGRTLYNPRTRDLNNPTTNRYLTRFSSFPRPITGSVSYCRLIHCAIPVFGQPLPHSSRPNILLCSFRCASCIRKRVCRPRLSLICAHSACVRLRFFAVSKIRFCLYAVLLYLHCFFYLLSRVFPSFNSAFPKL